MNVKLGPVFGSVNLRRAARTTSLLLGAALLMSGCLRPPHAIIGQDRAVWTETLGGPARTPYVAERAPENPEMQWQERFGRGYTDVPSLHGTLLIATSSAKTVTIANANTGKRYWERRLNGPVVGAIVYLNDRLYAATQSRDGRVEALYLSRGRHAWTFKMHAPAVGGALLVDSSLIVGNERAELLALRIDNGQPMWRVRLPAPLATTPILNGNEILAVTTRDSVVRVDVATGRQRPGVLLSGSVSAPIAVQNGRMLVPVFPDALQAIRMSDLQVEWTARAGSPILAAPALDVNGDVYILTRASDVLRIDNRGTATRIAQLGNAAASSLTLTSDGLLVGTLDGTVRLLRRDGSVVWTRSFPHSVRSPIAVRDGSIYVPLGDGHMVMMR